MDAAVIANQTTKRGAKMRNPKNGKTNDDWPRFFFFRVLFKNRVVQGCADKQEGGK